MWLPASQHLLLNASVDAPVLEALRAPGAAQFSRFHVRQDFFSGRVAAKVGVGIWGGGEASAKSLVLVYDALLSTDEERDVDIDGTLWRVRFGAGVRLEVSILEADANVRADIYSVALAVTMKSTSASFEMKALGITDPEIMKLLPGPASFDITSYEQVTTAADAIRLKMADGTVALTPVLTHIHMGAAPSSADLVRAQSLVFGVKEIQDGATVANARKAALEKRLSPIAVEAVYQQFSPRIGEDEKPAKDIRREAQRWLDTDSLIQR